MSRLIELLEVALGKKAMIDRQPMQPGDVPITFADISKARKKLGYNPKIKIEARHQIVCGLVPKKPKFSPDMNSPATFKRPTLTEALDAWKTILAERGFATELLWIFQENLCVENSRAERGGFRVGFQTNSRRRPKTRWTSRSIIFAKPVHAVVFYRLGNCPGKSVCVLLCDPWFENKSEAKVICAATNGKCPFTPAKKTKSRKSPT